MYTTTTAPREKALVAIAATLRAMTRHECCKSQFKFKCFSCGEMIHRGDKITRCTTSVKDGMELRFRGADSRNGLTFEETSFYLAQTGSRKWVHIGCNPCYWDSLPEDSNEYSPPALRGVYTDWGAKTEREFLEWCDSLPGRVFRSFPLFCRMKGYPKEKFMKDRIIRAVTRFQALWRGYLYKQAYPFALATHKATQAINLNTQASVAYKEEEEHDIFHPSIEAGFLEEWRQNAAAHRQKWLWSGEGAEDEHVNEPVTIFNIASQWWYGLEVGNHCEVLFNRGESKETIYSGEIKKIQEQCGAAYVWVEYHHDREVRRYHWKKFKLLKEECNEHKRKLGIEAKLVGRLNTARLALIGAASNNDWRYHYPDGTVVE